MVVAPVEVVVVVVVEEDVSGDEVDKEEIVVIAFEIDDSAGDIKTVDDISSVVSGKVSTNAIQKL